jgi:class 3 adenylate cyclase/tetratricopeptide (TPR) repeat protein
MQVCPNCGEENPERFRMCGFCGTALHQEATHEGEERKVVSALFVDIVGFTARSHRADPEDVVAALAPYQARLRHEIERFGGVREKFIGDAVVGVFGAPIAHEDDAERAVRAALSIIDAIEELNRKDPSLDLAVRAAVNTGEGLVSLRAAHRAGEGIVTGDVVNTASRLQGVAPVGGVVVGELTYRSTRSSINYEELEPVMVKGKPEPVLVWRALAPRSQITIDRVAEASTPFIGRRYDLLALEALYGRAMHENSVQLVTIMGEPGVGKSRTLVEFASFVEGEPDLIQWRQGRCLPYGEGITFWPLSEIIKAQAGILESDGSDQASGKLDATIEEVIGDKSEHEWFKARLGPLVGTKSSDETEIVDRGESFTAWRRFLEAEASRRPLILVFEDLHWADPATVEFIEHLVDWSDGVPLFVICVARPELYDNHPNWGGGKHNSNTISLSPLSDHETAELITRLIPAEKMSDEIRTTLLERAGGNPLYAEEYARMILDSDSVTPNGSPASGVSQVPFPETLHALIAARLDGLSSDQKPILQDASVAGRSFWSGALCSIGETDETTVRRALHELTLKELVRPARTSSMESQDEYSFWHALIREVAYGQIPRVARFRKHLAMATWIEHIARDRAAERAELIVYHYREALALARASGAQQEIPSLEERTCRFLVMAGDRAVPLDAAKSARYYAEALDLLPVGDPARGEILVKAADVCLGLGRFEESQDYLTQALTEFRSAGERAKEGSALAKLSKSLRDSGDTERSRELMATAIAILEEVGSSDELAYAYVQRGGDRLFSGSPSEALVLADRALQLAEGTGDSENVARALAVMGLARCELGDDAGIRDLRRALEITKDLGKPSWLSNAYVALAYTTWLSEGPEQAEQLYNEAIEVGDRQGVTGESMWARAESVWTLFDLGKWDEVLRRTDNVAEWERIQGGSQMRAVTLPYKAAVLLQRGEITAAAALADSFVPLARDIGDLQVLVPALAIGSAVRAASGDSSMSVLLVEELAERSRPTPSWRARFLPDAVRLLCSVGSLDPAQELLLHEDQVVTRRDRLSVATAKAVLAAAQHRFEEAEARFGEVAQRWHSYGAALEHAQVLLEGGRCALRLGHIESARTALQEAQNCFARLKATPRQAEADDCVEELRQRELQT